MISGLTCRFLSELSSPAGEVWVLAGGTRHFSDLALLVSQSQGELSAALCLVLSQQEHKWDFSCKTACLQDGD